MDWLDNALAEDRQRSRLRLPTTLQLESATRAKLDGRHVTLFCGNDYLGLRFHPRLQQAAHTAVDTHGTGSGASRLVAGNTTLHEQTERALAGLVHRPAALLTSSGFAANLGAIASLAGPEDVLFSDALNHASIVDGCRLSRARIAVYPHADTHALAEQIRRHRPFRRGWILTESVFSMDGDLAPLEELAQIARDEHLHLYVDDAHALGVYGPHGEGAVVECGVQTDVLVATLGKALGAGGAFVAGSDSLRLYLWNRCRSFVFSTALAPAVAGAALAAAEIVPQCDDLRARLQRNIEQLRRGLRELQLAPGNHPRSPIVPLLVGDDARAVGLSAALQDDGIFVQAIRPPTVPPGTARLRVTLTAAHEPEHIDQLLRALHRHRMLLATP